MSDIFSRHDLATEPEYIAEFLIRRPCSGPSSAHFGDIDFGISKAA